jgi:hypothetical protein
MNMRNDVIKMSEALPLALLNLRAKIATANNLHPERLGTLHARYCSVMLPRLFTKFIQAFVRKPEGDCSMDKNVIVRVPGEQQHLG